MALRLQGSRFTNAPVLWLVYYSKLVNLPMPIHPCSSLRVAWLEPELQTVLVMKSHVDKREPT
ncbi:predicted protein [Sclerotinia sclerotiorum 1980 UF-70]|uniref:Uncharacterized protein n=1 Tax=Sclerotinia sclerotiorum (strain ATCC 18683 / 1980 / Ss-1) TaxID=665079 RepID=A7EUK6_SCLS1|nr:predicted protein [Sclerotinia sclerotiorum 1980 UF-70]EDN93148.1 predicted protein [Sclerotinia sclerotiorum 1980 UF-70]